jgi:DNA-directed RNA polymerase specialized sigma24 family protein
LEISFKAAPSSRDRFRAGGGQKAKSDSHTAHGRSLPISSGHEQNWPDRTASKRLYSGMDSNGRAERDAKIYARRIEGFTWRAIAREFNLAVETVRVIAKRMECKAKWRERGVRLGGVN